MKLWELYQEENTSTLEHNGHIYSINKLLKFAEDIDVEEFDIDDLKWILKDLHLDPDRVNEKRVKYPILVTKEDKKLITLDGVHRLSKAIQLGHVKIKGKHLSHEMLEKAKLQ